MGPVAPQGLWMNHELLPIAEDGWAAGGHRWYRNYSGKLDAMAAGSGIHRDRLMDTYGLMGQGSDTRTNLLSTIKGFSRHLHGLYENPDHADELQRQGVVKSMFTSEPSKAATLQAILGRGINTKKLSAYSRGFRDSDLWHPSDSPHGIYGPVDMWMRRLFIGGDSAEQSDSLAHAVTGRSRSFLDHWHALHPDRPLNGSMLQAMLWTGYKRRTAALMHQLADHIEQHHSDKPNLMATVKSLRKDAQKIGELGTVDETWDKFGLDPARGLPASNSHGIISKYGADVAALADRGAVMADYFNHYKMSLPGKPGSTVDDRRAAIERWRAATGNEWGHVTDEGNLYLPKLKAKEYQQSLKEHGIELREDGSKAGISRAKAGPAKVVVRDQKAIDDFLEADPERAHALATLPLTARHLKSMEKKGGKSASPLARLLWADYGVLMEHIGNEAARRGYGDVHPEPIFYGGYKNARHDYSLPATGGAVLKAVDTRRPRDDRGAGAAPGARGGSGGDVPGAGDGQPGDGSATPALKLPERTGQAPRVTPGGVELPPAMQSLDDALKLWSQVDDGIRHAGLSLTAMAERVLARSGKDADAAMERGALSIIADTEHRPGLSGASPD